MTADKPVDYHALAERVIAPLAKAGVPLTDTQRIMLAGSLAVYVDLMLSAKDTDLAAAIARAEAAELDAAMFRRVMAIGKLPVRCSTGYYYSDGVIHPTPEAAIAAQQEPQS